MDIEATEAKQRIEIHTHLTMRRDVSKDAGALVEDGQDRLEVVGIKELADVARLFKQRIDLAAKKRAVTWCTLVERNLLDFHAGCVGDELHRDALHRAFLGDVGNGCLAALCLHPLDERRPVVVTGLVGADVDLREGDLRDHERNQVFGRIRTRRVQCMGRRGVVDMLKDIITVCRRGHIGRHSDRAGAARLVVTVDCDTGQAGYAFGHGSCHLARSTGRAVRYDHRQGALRKATRLVHRRFLDLALKRLCCTAYGKHHAGDNAEAEKSFHVFLQYLCRQ